MVQVVKSASSEATGVTLFHQSAPTIDSHSLWPERCAISFPQGFQRDHPSTPYSDSCPIYVASRFHTSFSPASSPFASLQRCDDSESHEPPRCGRIALVQRKTCRTLLSASLRIWPMSHA